VRGLPYVEEQRLLAVARTGDQLAAIAGLEAFIQRAGDTPERRGLLGGCCKRLWRAAREARVQAGQPQPSVDEAGWLDRAIAHYEAGLALDLNDFYCASNIARLLLARGEGGDAGRAHTVDVVLMEQCRRLIARVSADEWLRPTLLTAAVRAGNVAEARRLVRQVERDGPAAWKVDTVLRDVADDIARMPAGEGRAAMDDVRARLAALIPRATPPSDPRPAP
jgi:hypothetical protein